jgi:hypothetical protein
VAVQVDTAQMSLDKYQAVVPQQKSRIALFL